jgi:hypothetical protein
MTTNYQQLKTIYQQRRNHRLPEWQTFCDWCETLPSFLYLTQQEKDNNQYEITHDEIHKTLEKYRGNDKDYSIIGWAFGREVFELLLDETSKTEDADLQKGLVYAAYIVDEKYIQPKEIKENENN